TSARPATPWSASPLLVQLTPSTTLALDSQRPSGATPTPSPASPAAFYASATCRSARGPSNSTAPSPGPSSRPS
ncbi:hypothetical protein H9P43_010169, partial [Blastocladiella emersonii ATCC 22665]